MTTFTEDRRLPIVLALVIALLAAACGGDSGDDTDAAAADGEAPVASVTASATPTTSENTPTPAPTSAPPSTPAPSVTPTPEAPPARTTIADLLALDRPLSIAHAGGDQDAPHSTPFAFDQAVANGADVLEIDVQLTADGVLIVQHDDTVDKTTEATGPVVELTLAEIQALDNAYWFSPACWPCQDRPAEEYLYRGVRTGETSPPPGAVADDFIVPTFRELVERHPEYPFDIEIKGSGEAGIAVAEALAAEIVDLGVEDSVVVVTFDDAILARFEELAPDVETSPGTAELTEWLLGGVPLEGHRIVQVPPVFQGIEVINDAFWAAAAEADVAVWVWPDDASTQENEAFYRDMIAQGADGLIAGRPAAMAAARTE